MEATQAVRRQNLRSLTIESDQLSPLAELSKAIDDIDLESDISLPEIVVHFPDVSELLTGRNFDVGNRNHAQMTRTSGFPSITPEGATQVEAEAVETEFVETKVVDAKVVARQSTGQEAANQEVINGQVTFESETLKTRSETTASVNRATSSPGNADLLSELLEQITPTTESEPQTGANASQPILATLESENAPSPGDATLTDQHTVVVGAYLPELSDQETESLLTSAKPDLPLHAMSAESTESEGSSTSQGDLPSGSTISGPTDLTLDEETVDRLVTQEVPSSDVDEKTVANHKSAAGSATTATPNDQRPLPPSRPLVAPVAKSPTRTSRRTPGGKPATTSAPIRPHRVDLPDKPTHARHDQYVELVDNLIARSTPNIPSVLMFTAAEGLTEASNHVEQIANHYLVKRSDAKILLIDGRVANRVLSSRLAGEDSGGLAETIHQGESWQDLVRPTRHANLSFLPAGNGILSFRRATSLRLAELCAQWKEEYDCIIIDGGDQEELIPRLLCPFCDATYLLVTLGVTDPAVAKAAVTELRAYGARLLGCVVTERA